MFDNINFESSGSGSGSAFRNAILNAIVFLTETEKKAVTPEAIAIYLNKNGHNTDRREVRRALQKIRNVDKATVQKDGRFTQEVQSGLFLNFSTGQGCNYAAVRKDDKGKK